MRPQETNEGPAPVKTAAAAGRTQRLLVAIVVAGAILIAGIGFAGSYAAVRDLAEQKGFGAFAPFFPIGIDAGIVVLLALDLLLTWIRIPFPLLRQTAWLLTAATIAFNGAAAWPDPLGVGMHAVIPVLFVVTVEAARHAIGRVADITADKHMEGVRISRWLLAFPSTFRLWRRMKLWELRSYEQVIAMEQDRLVYETQLRSRYGKRWRSEAPVEATLPLQLARYGVPLTETAQAGLAAAGIESDALLKRLARPKAGPHETPEAQATTTVERADREGQDQPAEDRKQLEHAPASPEPERVPEQDGSPAQPETMPAPHETVPSAGGNGSEPVAAASPAERGDTGTTAPQEVVAQEPVWPTGSPASGPQPAQLAEAEEAGEAVPYETYVKAFQFFTAEHGTWPNARQLGVILADAYGVTDPATGGPLPEQQLRPLLTELRQQLPHPEATPAPTSPPDAAPAPRRVPAAASVGETADTGRQAPTGRENTASASGEATARVPQQQTHEMELTQEEQRVRTVAVWIAEAEESGEKLSGAEVARRLDVAPRTGQRTLKKAREYHDEQQRQQTRSRLRSVAASR